MACDARARRAFGVVANVVLGVVVVIGAASTVVDGRAFDVTRSKYGVDADDGRPGWMSTTRVPKRALGVETLGKDLHSVNARTGRLNVYEAAYERSYRGEIILITTNEGGLALTANAVSNLRSIGVEHFLVYTESETTCREGLMNAGGRDIDCAWTSYLLGHPRLPVFNVHRDDGADAFRLWWSRFEYMYLLSGEGYNVMYVDTDVSFRYNPYPVFKVGPLAKFQVFAQAEQSTVDQLNIGFMYIQNAKIDGIARGVFNETINRMLAVLESDPPLRNWRNEIAVGAKESLWDQHIFNDVVESAVVGRYVNPRQGQRVVAPEKRDQWLAQNNFPSRQELRWTTERVIVPENLLPGRVRHDKALHDTFSPPSMPGFEIYSRKLVKLDGYTYYGDEFVAAPPFWVIDGWTGAGWSPKTQGANNMWHGEEPPVIMTHFVGGTDKALEMKALGWWDYAAEEYTPKSSRLFHHESDENRRRTHFIAVKGLKLSNFTSTDRKSSEALYKLKVQTYRLMKLGALTKRSVVTPSVSCDEDFIDKQPQADFGVWSQNDFVLSTRCGLNAKRKCCLPKRMSCNGFNVGAIDFFNDDRYADVRADRSSQVSVAIAQITAGIETERYISIDALAKVNVEDVKVLVLDLADFDGILPDVRSADISSEVDFSLRQAARMCANGFFRKDFPGSYPW